MTNQTRDFDQSDGRVLAEFADIRYGDDAIKVEVNRRTERHHIDLFTPWDLMAPMWQRKVLLDAVREKGLVNEFRDNLIDEIDASEPGLSIIDGVEAPSEAICASILELEETK